MLLLLLLSLFLLLFLFLPPVALAPVTKRPNMKPWKTANQGTVKLPPKLGPRSKVADGSFRLLAETVTVTVVMQRHSPAAKTAREAVIEEGMASKLVNEYLNV